MRDKSINNAEQLGARIRLKRKEKGLSQSTLANLLGVERKWVLKLEAGNPKAEFGRVLQALQTLDLRLFLDEPTKPAASDGQARSTSTLGEVFSRVERREFK